MQMGNTETVPGRDIGKGLGVVIGSTVRAKWFGQDVGAWFKSLIGGEIKGYSEMLIEARQQAIERMVEQATELGADAIVNVRFAASQVMGSSAELLARHGGEDRITVPSGEKNPTEVAKWIDSSRVKNVPGCEPSTG